MENQIKAIRSLLKSLGYTPSQSFPHMFSVNLGNNMALAICTLDYVCVIRLESDGSQSERRFKNLTQAIGYFMTELAKYPDAAG